MLAIVNVYRLINHNVVKASIDSVRWFSSKVSEKILNPVSFLYRRLCGVKAIISLFCSLCVLSICVYKK